MHILSTDIISSPPLSPLSTATSIASPQKTIPSNQSHRMAKGSSRSINNLRNHAAMKTIIYSTLASLLILATHGAPSLKKVGDVGRVVDSEGISSVRPTAGNRWTCASPSLPIKPGDWLRTDIRGANALHVKLAGGSELILGPGTLIEVVKPTEIKLLRGEVDVSPGA
jgi:hypothetical protein